MCLLRTSSDSQSASQLVYVFERCPSSCTAVSGSVWRTKNTPSIVRVIKIWLVLVWQDNVVRLNNSNSLEPFVESSHCNGTTGYHRLRANKTSVSFCTSVGTFCRMHYCPWTFNYCRHHKRRFLVSQVSGIISALRRQTSASRITLEAYHVGLSVKRPLLVLDGTFPVCFCVNLCVFLSAAAAASWLMGTK